MRHCTNEYNRKYNREHPEWYRLKNDRYLFNGNRKKALERDNFTCVECGMTNEEHINIWKRGLVVHHIDGRGLRCSGKDKNNNLNNLITLCMKCHRKKHQPTKPKPIVQLSKNGDFIREYDGVSQASKITGITLSGIYQTVIGNLKQSHGYLWIYKNKYEEKGLIGE